MACPLHCLDIKYSKLILMRQEVRQWLLQDGPGEGPSKDTETGFHFFSGRTLCYLIWGRVPWALRIKFPELLEIPRPQGRTCVVSPTCARPTSTSATSPPFLVEPSLWPALLQRPLVSCHFLTVLLLGETNHQLQTEVERSLLDPSRKN